MTEVTSAPPSTTGDKAPKRRPSVAQPPVGRRFSAAFNVPIAAKPVLRYMPTYRLEPKVPLNKERCENIMKVVMNRAFEGYQYTPKHSLSLSSHLAEEIKNRIKLEYFDRYRYVVMVTIGEKVMQGFSALVNFLWDAERDGYVSYSIDDPYYFAVATVYYIYYD